MELNIAICDDEKTYIDSIRKYLVKYFEKRKAVEYSIKGFSTGEALIDYHKKNRIDLVFLDIDLDDLDGYETAERLREIDENIMIAFVSNHNDKLFYTCKYYPLALIRKKYLNEVTDALEEAVSKLSSRSIKELQMKFKMGKLEVSEKNGNILYFEVNKHYTTMHTKQGDIEERCSLNELESKLKQFNFIRIHIAYMVNLCNILEIDGNVVILSDENRTSLPVSRQNMEKLKKAFQKYNREVR